MSKANNNSTVKKQPPLYINLSPEAATHLEKIRAARSWNKKTAVETALRFLAASLGKAKEGAS